MRCRKTKCQNSQRYFIDINALNNIAIIFKKQKSIGNARMYSTEDIKTSFSIQEISMDKKSK